MTSPVGPSYLTAHLAMKHPAIAAAVVCIPLLAWVQSNPDVGYVLFTFDDNNVSDYSVAYPILIDNGFPATVYITDSNIGKDGYMTRAQINLLNEWEIGYHTISHPSLITLDANQLENEVGVSSETVRSFASPYGDYNDEVISAIKTAGYTSHVNAWTDIPENDGINDLPIKNNYNINRLTINSEMNYEEVCAKAPEKDKALVLLFHRIVPDDYDKIEKWDITQSNFEKIVECFEGYNTTTISKLIEIGK